MTMGPSGRRAEGTSFPGLSPAGHAPPRTHDKAPPRPICDLSFSWSPLLAFWLDIAAFALKALLIVAAIGALALLIARLTRSGEPKDEEIKVRSLNERYDDMRDALNSALLDKKARKALVKARKKEAKARAKARTGGEDPAKRLYVLAFKGDMRASAVKRLGHEIDAVLTVARPGTDEVALRLDSPGGTVTGYGLAAAEILRLRERKIAVTALVDQVAASGGYMMACAADRIVAAPFAVVGSIGVVAPVPNLHRLLKKNEIDFEEITAGEWKRSVSVLGEITPAGREHFRGKLDATHGAFKAFRPAMPPQRGHRPGRQRRPLARERGAGLRPRRSALDRRRLSLSRPRERASLRGLDRGAQDPRAADPQRRRRRRAEGGRFRGGEAKRGRIVAALGSSAADAVSDRVYRTAISAAHSN